MGSDAPPATRQLVVRDLASQARSSEITAFHWQYFWDRTAIPIPISAVEGIPYGRPSFVQESAMLDCPALTRVHWPDLHSRFGDVLPAVQAQSRSAFAGLRTAEDREDDAALAAWMRFLRAAAASTIIDPVELARRAVASVARRLHQRARFAV
jgi:hypothetical protein